MWFVVFIHSMWVQWRHTHTHTIDKWRKYKIRRTRCRTKAKSFDWTWNPFLCSMLTHDGFMMCARRVCAFIFLHHFKFHNPQATIKAIIAVYWADTLVETYCAMKLMWIALTLTYIVYDTLYGVNGVEWNLWKSVSDPQSNMETHYKLYFFLSPSLSSNELYGLYENTRTYAQQQQQQHHQHTSHGSAIGCRFFFFFYF